MDTNLNIEKLYNEAKIRLNNMKQKDIELFKSYKTFEKKSDSLGKLYYLTLGNWIDYYVTYKLNPTSSDVIKKYQRLQGNTNSTLSKVDVLGNSVVTSIDIKQVGLCLEVRMR